MYINSYIATDLKKVSFFSSLLILLKNALAIQIKFMLYFAWQQIQQLLSLIWLSSLHTIKIAYTSCCTYAFSWVANTVCHSLVTCIAVTEINRSALPLPMTLVKLGLLAQVADSHRFKTGARFSLLLWRLTKRIMLGAVVLRFYWESIKLWSQAETLTLGFQFTERTQQRPAEEMSKCYKRRDTQENPCLLVRFVLDLATYFINSRQNPKKL